jgi:hypothetical protein
LAAAGESTGKTTKVRMPRRNHGPKCRSMDRSLTTFRERVTNRNKDL